MAFSNTLAMTEVSCPGNMKGQRDLIGWLRYGDD